MADPLAPVDTSVTIPASVRRAAEAANALHATPTRPIPLPSPNPIRRCSHRRSLI